MTLKDKKDFHRRGKKSFQVVEQKPEPRLIPSIPLCTLGSLRNLKDSKRNSWWGWGGEYVAENLLKYRFICKIKFVSLYKERVLYVIKFKGLQVLVTCNPGR